MSWTRLGGMGAMVVLATACAQYVTPLDGTFVPGVDAATSQPDTSRPPTATDVAIQPPPRDVVTPVPIDAGGPPPGTCNALSTAMAPGVVLTAVNTPPMQATGGVITPGVYELVAARLFGGAPGPSGRVRAVIQLTTSALQMVTASEGTPGEQATSYGITPSGNSLNMVGVCPADAPVPAGGGLYTSAGISFVLQYVENGVVLELEFRRR